MPTAHRALHVPAESDVPDIPADWQTLADQLDFDLFVITGARPAAGVLGRVHYDGSGVFSFDTGSAWISYLVSIPGGVYLQLAGGTMAGGIDMAGSFLANAAVRGAKDITASADVTGAVTIDAAAQPQLYWRLTGNITGWTINNFMAGMSLRITLQQDGTGGRTVVWPAWLWPGGAAVATAVFDTAVGAVNTLVLDRVKDPVTGTVRTEAFLAGSMKV